MEIGERIKKRREDLGLTQEDLAIMLGYKNRSTVNKWEKDGSKLRQSKIAEIAEALNTTPAYLMGWEDNNKPAIDISQCDNIIPITTQKLPLLGEIACGKPTFAQEDKETYIEVGTDVKADFCLRAKGDSMIGARILDGDIVFIKQQPVVENGEIAAVIINDEATLKRVYMYPDKLILNAENPKYEPLVYIDKELEQIHILGKALAFQSNVK